MIHPQAIVHPGARIGADVEIGPFAVIGENVTLGDGTWVGPHAVIEGWTEIGKNNRIFQFASVGADPQDLKFRGEKSFLRLGDSNTVREFVTLHRGTQDGNGETVIGNNNLFMAYSHVAHDCIVGNRVILANGATLAGHVTVDDHAILGGLSAVHQFTRIGCHVMISGGSMVAQDIVPYTIAQGDRAKTVGINLIGLKRRGYSEEALRKIKQAYKLVFRANLKLEEAIARIEAECVCPEVEPFLAFLKDRGRGIAR